MHDDNDHKVGIPDDVQEIGERLRKAVAKEFGVEPGRIKTINLVEMLQRVGLDEEEACSVNVASVLLNGDLVNKFMNALDHLAVAHGNMLAANAMQALLPLIEDQERVLENGFERMKASPELAEMREVIGPDKVPDRAFVLERREHVENAVRKATAIDEARKLSVSSTKH